MKYQVVMRDELGQWSTAGSWGSEYAIYDTEAEAQDAIQELRTKLRYSEWAVENVDE